MSPQSNTIETMGKEQTIQTALYFSAPGRVSVAEEPIQHWDYRLSFISFERR